VYDALCAKTLMTGLSLEPGGGTDCFQGVGFHRWRCPVNHGVTVRAERDHIIYRVGPVILTHRMQRDPVMHVDKVPPGFAVKLLKAEAASLTPVAMVPQAGFSCRWITFVSINEDLRFALSLYKAEADSSSGSYCATLQAYQTPSSCTR
jgi:hypothetical protein